MFIFLIFKIMCILCEELSIYWVKLTTELYAWKGIVDSGAQILYFTQKNEIPSVLNPRMEVLISIEKYTVE